MSSCSQMSSSPSVPQPCGTYNSMKTNAYTLLHRSDHRLIASVLPRESANKVPPQIASSVIPLHASILFFQGTISAWMICMGTQEQALAANS